MKWLWTFRLSIISIFFTWAESSIWYFLSAAFIENSKSYQSITTTSTSYLRKLESSVAGTSSAIFENLSNLLYTLFFYKQLGLGLSPQGYLYFQRFWGSKLLNGCLVVPPSNLCLQGIQWFSGLKIHQWFLNFPKNSFETVKFWSLDYLTAIFTFLSKGKFHFPLIRSFCCCLLKEGWTLKVAYQFAIPGLVAYKPVA